MKNTLKTFTALLFVLNVMPAIATTTDDMQKDIDALTAAFDNKIQNLQNTETTQKTLDIEEQKINKNLEELEANTDEHQEFQKLLDEEANQEEYTPIDIATCGNLGQKECDTNYKVCEKNGQIKECTGDMLPRYATKGHCVSAGRSGYKICTATECDNNHTPSNGHCNNPKEQTPENKTETANTTKTTDTEKTNSVSVKQLCTSNGGEIEKEFSSTKIWCKIRGECNRTQHVLQKEIDDKKLSIRLNYRCKDATEGFCSTGHTCEIISTAKNSSTNTKTSTNVSKGNINTSVLDTAKQTEEKNKANTEKRNTLNHICIKHGGIPEKEFKDSATIWCKIPSCSDTKDNAFKQAVTKAGATFNYRDCKVTTTECGTGHTCEMKM